MVSERRRSVVRAYGRRHRQGETNSAKPEGSDPPSHFRGKPKADYIDGRAELETDPETVKKYRLRIYKRYGLQGTFAKLSQRFSRSKAKDIIIIIQP